MNEVKKKKLNSSLSQVPLQYQVAVKIEESEDMPFSDSQNYAPYFHDGRLYLPNRTVELLIQAGLEREVAQAALEGLALDDDHEHIGLISNMLERVMGQIAENSEAFRQLNSSETRFMLTGRREI